MSKTTKAPVKESAGIGKGTPGPGRKKGVPNKNTALIREMVAQALDEAGGVAYLVSVAHSHPGPFLGLVGKVLPVQLTGAGDEPLSISVAFVRPNGEDEG